MNEGEPLQSNTNLPPCQKQQNQLMKSNQHIFDRTVIRYYFKQPKKENWNFSLFDISQKAPYKNIPRSLSFNKGLMLQSWA